jgi:8-oxo-dGTP diphosphatase
MLKLATLCYVKSHGQTLMLHRVKKQNDMHAGKWNGLGGKLEAGETPEACVIREVREESGLTIIDPVLRGLLTFPAFAHDEDWYAFVFVARKFSGQLIDSAEGRLEWIDDERLLDLNLWEGDRIFLRWLDDDAFFSGRFDYIDGRFLRHSVVFYQGHSVTAQREDATKRPQPSLVSQAEADAPPNLVYHPRDDTYCWLCNRSVIKRHCKIVCQHCGFTRDCSDP